MGVSIDNCSFTPYTCTVINYHTMQTAITTPQGNLVFITQQYVVGLYVAIYEADKNFKTIGMPQQGSSTKQESKFHQDLRKEALKEGHFVQEHSTTI